MGGVAPAMPIAALGVVNHVANLALIMRASDIEICVTVLGTEVCTDIDWSMDDTPNKPLYLGGAAAGALFLPSPPCKPWLPPKRKRRSWTSTTVTTRKTWAKRKTRKPRKVVMTTVTTTTDREI